MLKNRNDLILLRSEAISALTAEKQKILVCAGTGCVSSGSLEIYEKLSTLMRERKIPCMVQLEEDRHDHAVALKKSGCHGFCEMGPLIRIEPHGFLYTKVQLEDCEEIVDRTILKGEPIERLAFRKDGIVYPKQEEIPFYRKQTRVVL